VKRPAPPPNYPRDAAKPPLYPIDPKPGDPRKPGAKPLESAGAKFDGTGTGLFGMKTGEMPTVGGLFGDDGGGSGAVPSELFADSIPSAPDYDDDAPMDAAPQDNSQDGGRPRTGLEDGSDDELDAADEGGGVALPADPESEPDEFGETDRLGMPEPSYDAPASEGEIEMGGGEDEGPDAMISMDDIFSGSRQAPPASAPRQAPTPAFGTGGVLPAPFLKPVEAPHAAHPAGGRAEGVHPFALLTVEGISEPRFDLSGGEVYLLGRDKDAHVKILSTSVSRRHARIDATGGEHVLIDLGSANGTQVNGQSVARQALKEGDLIRMGKVILRYAPV
jgi:hypothetical protein